MKLILVISSFLLAFAGSVKGQTERVKLIIPGEHLGYELASFDINNKPVKTKIAQGESWPALYMGLISLFFYN